MIKQVVVVLYSYHHASELTDRKTSIVNTRSAGEYPETTKWIIFLWSAWWLIRLLACWTEERSRHHLILAVFCTARGSPARSSQISYHQPIGCCKWATTLLLNGGAMHGDGWDRESSWSRKKPTSPPKNDKVVVGGTSSSSLVLFYTHYTLHTE
jgi:hypothetical protein